MNQDEQILKKRARQLAKKQESINTDAEENETLVVNFLLFPENYAIAADYVEEVLTLKEITPLPGASEYMVGVINFRGNIVPVVNLKILFLLTEQGLTEMNKVLILRKDQIIVGLLADGITGTQNIVMHQLAEPPLNLSNIGKEFITGLMPDDTIVLDASKILNRNLLNKRQQ